MFANILKTVVFWILSWISMHVGQFIVSKLRKKKSEDANAEARKSSEAAVTEEQRKDALDKTADNF